MKKPLFNHLCKQQPVMLTIITTTVNICTTLTMYQALLLGPHLVPTVTEADDRHIIMTPHIVPRWQSCFSKPGNSGSLNFALNHQVCDTHLMRTRDWLKDKDRKFKKVVLNKFLLKKYFIFFKFYLFVHVRSQLWHVTKGGTQDTCIGIVESQTLDLQGRPQSILEDNYYMVLPPFQCQRIFKLLNNCTHFTCQ